MTKFLTQTGGSLGIFSDGKRDHRYYPNYVPGDKSGYKIRFVSHWTKQPMWKRQLKVSKKIKL